MLDFYRGFDREDIVETLLYQKSKFIDIKNRYAWKVRERFSEGFVKKGMQMVRGQSREVENNLRTFLYDKYIAPTKRKRENYIGIEIEMPILNLAKEAVDFFNIHKITKSFMARFSFAPVKYDENGDVCLAENKKTGDILSYDCSYNNLELSLGRVKNISEAESRFRKYYCFLQESLSLYNYTPTELRHLFIRKDLPSFVDQNAVYRLCENVLEIAREGLKDRGLGEEKYLEPLYYRVKNQENPGAYMLRHLSEGTELEEIVREFAVI